MFDDLTLQGRLLQTDDAAEEKDLRPSAQRPDSRSAVDQASACAQREDREYGNDIRRRAQLVGWFAKRQKFSRTGAVELRQL